MVEGEHRCAEERRRPSCARYSQTSQGEPFLKRWLHTIISLFPASLGQQFGLCSLGRLGCIILCWGLSGTCHQQHQVLLEVACSELAQWDVCLGVMWCFIFHKEGPCFGTGCWWQSLKGAHRRMQRLLRPRLGTCITSWS